MKTAILVDIEYFRRLEHLHEELCQVRLTDSSVIARRHLTAALDVCAQVGERLEEMVNPSQEGRRK